MAYYSLFPERDTTLYSHPDRKIMNTGHDEILELTKEKNSDDQLYYPTRILIKFKNEEIKSVLTNIIGRNTEFKTSLNLFQIQNENLIQILNLDVFAVSQSWDEGTGRYSNLPTSSNGSSWIYRNNTTLGAKWPTGSAPVPTTFGSSSILLMSGSDALPTGSAHQLTINGVDFIPVISSSLFNDSLSEKYVEISSSITLFGANMVEAINATQSLTLVSASYKTDAAYSLLILSGSNTGSSYNITVTTSSIDGQNQSPFRPATGSNGFSLQGGTDVANSGQIFAAGTTGSISSSLLTAGGGSWYTGSEFRSTQQFITADNLDTNFDVTAIVKKHSASLLDSSIYPTGIDNNGFLIKHPDSVEAATSSSYGLMQYFSVDTNTIFPPKLTFKWDDSIHEYHSSAKTEGELNVSLYRNKKEYNQNEVSIFRVNVRDKYPTRTFVTSSNYLNPGYFTTASYYSIRDASKEEIVIPFDDNYTKMSADSEGMYFKIYMKGLQPERYYRILFKHVNDDGTHIYDNNYIFKVIR